MPKQSRKPVDPSYGPVAQFGFDLRAERQQAGLTYAQLAQRTFYSVGAIHRADQGYCLPTAQLTECFIVGCGKDPKPWLERREKIAQQLRDGRVSAARRSYRDCGVPPPDPTMATTVVEYVDALKELREWSGMTYRQLENTASGYARRLPASTVCKALRRQTLPPEELVESLVRAIGLPEPTRLTWIKVLRALRDGRSVPRGPTWKRWTTEAHTMVCRPAPVPLEDADGVVYPGETVRDWVYADGTWKPADEGPRRSWWSRMLDVFRRDER